MTSMVRRLVDENQCEKAWHHLCERGHPALQGHLRPLKQYEKWKAALERGVASFWTVQGERLAFLVGYQDEEPVGLVRVLKVPVYPWDKEDWGEVGFRGEIQDLIFQKTGEDVARELVKEAMTFLKQTGIERIGASCWREDQCKILRSLGFKPLRRNILLGWATDHDVQFEASPSCNIHYLKPGEEKLVREVFTSTWGFPVTFLPNMEIQQALVALSNEEPLGTVLMSNHSGSIDLGVQVVSSHRRKHIGSLLVREALSYYRKKDFGHMYLIRNIPVNGLRVEDEVALQFYASTGAFPLREYVGFQSL